MRDRIDSLSVLGERIISIFVEQRRLESTHLEESECRQSLFHLQFSVSFKLGRMLEQVL
jgi:hypothetical protein